MRIVLVLAVALTVTASATARERKPSPFDPLYPKSGTRSKKAPASAARTSANRASPTAVQPGALRGKATFYASSMDGRTTAAGDVFDSEALTAAHRSLPLGSSVRVTNTANNKSVVVRINDRGPHGSAARIISVTRRAAEELDFIDDGVADVIVEPVETK